MSVEDLRPLLPQRHSGVKTWIDPHGHQAIDPYGDERVDLEHRGVTKGRRGRLDPEPLTGPPVRAHLERMI